MITPPSPVRPIRGFMLDISRDKVPTLTTLLELVDLLAELGYNHLQLYMEHTFAFAGHEVVWRDASPLGAADVTALQARCRARAIELVPNQNSFGHMERWLRHDAYAPLAEDPQRRLTLCPLDPRTVELMSDLYGQLLPHFDSRLFNIGCDETWELGEGRSREACGQRGRGRVYLEYLQQLSAIVREHGRTPMFWGDIILKYPELIGELPRDVIALQWGYAAHQPHEEHSRAFAAAGVPFVVCPGVSGWNSIIGRGEDLLPNMANAVRLARAHGAIGLLVTEWGDNGHWQHWPVMLPGLVAGAIACGGEAPTEAAVADGISRLLGDAKGRCGRALVALALAQADVGVRVHNNSPLHLLLQRPVDPLPESLTLSAIDGIEQRIGEALRLWNEGRPARWRPELIDREVRHGAALALHACRLGRARIQAGGTMAAIPPGVRAQLAGDLRALIGEFRELWLERNRPGGLEDSVARFGGVLRGYEEVKSVTDERR